VGSPNFGGLGQGRALSPGFVRDAVNHFAALRPRCFLASPSTEVAFAMRACDARRSSAPTSITFLCGSGHMVLPWKWSKRGDCFLSAFSL